jgi:hypothetical protein
MFRRTTGGNAADASPLETLMLGVTGVVGICIVAIMINLD